jgi:putative SOS response-associated peptidase YedK
MATMHDRMPVVLEVEDVDRWLKEPEAALLKPAADGVLTAHRVSSRVNSPRNNDAALVEGAAEPPPAQAGLFG